ncbi:alpha/beta fold hydrolase [Cohnella zeiphila]|uniref:Alpha/beta hydrolase n=1 Tax=Cohnella zeiphila TaxID=2761120 RepID=A0A7X0VUC0_9BACL|nr:alpha/beta hydrolase [Cohnella zeiphila]MBB6730821.1 alpha/beta hydrolase [Cohnella zeiphila]
MSEKKTGYLSVPGAELYYEVRGTGPALLMIHGGNGDADVYSGVAERLADRYSVIAYDRRGHSRSRQADEGEAYRVSTHSDDAARLLAELTDSPAYVFGSSSGAVIGLDFALRHSGQIRLLVAHEPPLTHLLAGEERERARHIQEQLESVSRREGALPAIKQFASALGLDQAGGRPDRRPDPEQLARMAANMKYFLMHESPAIRRHVLDTDDLRAAPDSQPMRIAVGGGADSRGTFPYQCAAALAEKLNADLAEFPGNHLGYVRQSEAFAETLHRVIGG